MALKGNLIFSPITDIELSDRLGIDDLETEIAGKSTVTYTPTVTSGTELGKIKIDGTTKKIYAPESVSDVTVTQTVTSGTELATITVDSTDTKIYAPTIPPTKHLEWVTVASGTAETSYASQFAELANAYNALTDDEKEISIIERGSYIYEISRIGPSPQYSRVTVLDSVTYILELDIIDGLCKQCQITHSSGTISYSDISTVISSSPLKLKVFRLVDNE